jgi:hypothetical protein
MLTYCTFGTVQILFQNLHIKIFEKGQIRTRFRNKSGLEPQHCIYYFVPDDEPPPARQAGEERRTGFRSTWAPLSAPPSSGSDALQPETERARCYSCQSRGSGMLIQDPGSLFFLPGSPGYRIQNPDLQKRT